jgi:hypothetical protein
MVEIPWPITNAPGDEAQEGGGKLINVFAQRRGDDQGVVWRRVPGASVFVVDPSVGAAAGTAIGLGVSHIEERAGMAAGTATAPGVGAIRALIGGAGAAQGAASATGTRSMLIAVDGSADGQAGATAGSTV